MKLSRYATNISTLLESTTGHSHVLQRYGVNSDLYSDRMIITTLVVERHACQIKQLKFNV